MFWKRDFFCFLFCYVYFFCEVSHDQLSLGESPSSSKLTFENIVGVNTYVCRYIYAYTCIHIYIYIYVHIYIFIFLCMYTCRQRP